MRIGPNMSARKGKTASKYTGESSVSSVTSAGVKHTSGSAPLQFGLYLSKASGIEERFNRLYNEHSMSSIGLSDILSQPSGQLIESAQFSFLFEVDWLIGQYPPAWRERPLYLVYGTKEGNERDTVAIEEAAKRHESVVLVPVPINDKYGSHHTKLMLLLYDVGLRIILPTANATAIEWSKKTQGVWLSPIFPRLDAHSAENCATGFKDDLVQYLESYESTEISKWIETIKKHDFSAAKVFLIASVPGRHIGVKRCAFGHMKLRKVLSGEYGPSPDCADWPVICQFSSIGSLGERATSWLMAQFLSSLAMTKAYNLEKPQLKCIFPSVENVRSSLEGYEAGTHLSYTSKVAQRQPYLNKLLHQWVASATGRSAIQPHIKTYCRLSADNSEVLWFLLTSANLSKAAWGELQNTGSQLFIRSFELGVLFLPEMLRGVACFRVKPDKGGVYFPLPYDVPLTKYSDEDEIWVQDKVFSTIRDHKGNIWPVNGYKQR